MSDVIRRQLLAIRGNAAATLATVDAILGAIEERVEPALGSGTECQHPPEARVEAARMGHPAGWHCTACGAEGG